MDELHKDLKMQITAHRLTIEEAQNKIKHIQDNLCLHVNEELVNYEERVGRIIPFTRVCSICGIVIKEKIK